MALVRKSRAPLPSPLEAAEKLYFLYCTELQLRAAEALALTVEMLLRRYPELTPLQAKLVARKAAEPYF